MPYCASIADRRLNSSIKIRCLFLHFLSLAQDAPHPLHKAIVVFTPTPHPVHGIIPPPLSTKGLWKLQYSPMQLLPHISAFPISSHAQMFLPLILLLLYSDTPIIQMEIFLLILWYQISVRIIFAPRASVLARLLLPPFCIQSRAIV